MKKLRICLEIQGLAEDENGNPCPAGLCMTLGEVPEEGFNEKYNALIQRVKIREVLKLVCLNEDVSEDRCRIITPEEYDEKYGDEED